MTTNPFEGTESYEVKATSTGVTPKKPVYEPAALLEHIRQNSGVITSVGIQEYLGNELVAMCAEADFEVSGLIERTEDFKWYPEKGIASVMYRLTDTGREVNPADLQPRYNIYYVSGDIAPILNRLLASPGRTAKEIMECFNSEERRIIEEVMIKLRFPGYNRQ